MKKRFNFIVKSNFFKQLEEKYKNVKHVTFQYSILKLFKKKMLFVGNIQNAQTVFLIPYNTKRGYLWFKQLYYPFDILKELRKNLMGRFIPVLLLYFLFVSGILFSTLFISYNVLVFQIFLYIVIMVMMALAFLGYGSLNNQASGDAALIFADKLIYQQDATLRNRIGVIFVDTSDRLTLSKQLAIFFKKYNKNPHVVEVSYFSGDEIFVASTKQNTRKVSQFAKKHKLGYKILPFVNEYYQYPNFSVISYGVLDKENDVMMKYSLKNKEVFNQIQFDKIYDIALAYHYD